MSFHTFMAFGQNCTEFLKELWCCFQLSSIFVMILSVCLRHISSFRVGHLNLLFSPVSFIYKYEKFENMSSFVKFFKSIIKYVINMDRYKLWIFGLDFYQILWPACVIHFESFSFCTKNNLCIYLSNIVNLLISNVNS